jgi:transcriptional regulator with XRE-family HTH domain
MTSPTSLSTRSVQIGTLYFVALLREELGRRIAAARNAAGLSQQELAEKIGLKHAQDVSRYERGKVEVPGHRIDRIAEATGRPRSYFTRDPSEPEATPSASVDELSAKVDRLASAVEELRHEILAELQARPSSRQAAR